jgi:hypothetical protein
MDLREKIANVLIEMASEGYEEAYPLADAILDIPEIKEALDATKAWHDVMLLGTGFMKDGKRIDPAEVYIKPPEPGPNEIYSHDVGKPNA